MGGGLAREGKMIELGQVNEITGLKSIFSKNANGPGAAQGTNRTSMGATHPSEPLMKPSCGSRRTGSKRTIRTTAKH